MSIFKNFLSKKIDKSNDIIKNNQDCILIFDKEYFTLKELCNLFLEISIKINYNLEYPSQIIRSFSQDYYRKIIIDQNKLDSDEIYNIYKCYMNFSSKNEKYRDFLKNTRIYRGLIIINNKKIYMREILQILDINFNKLVIRINTELSDYDITISWDQFEDKVKNLTKKELEELINKKTE
jgi:hypothetical protein